jgi:hypothetical protein
MAEAVRKESSSSIAGGLGIHSSNKNKTLSLYKGLKVRLPGLTPGKELASVLFADATSSNCGESMRAMNYQVARGNTAMAGVMT